MISSQLGNWCLWLLCAWRKEIMHVFNTSNVLCYTGSRSNYLLTCFPVCVRNWPSVRIIVRNVRSSRFCAIDNWWEIITNLNLIDKQGTEFDKFSVIYVIFLVFCIGFNCKKLMQWIFAYELVFYLYPENYIESHEIIK